MAKKAAKKKAPVEAPIPDGHCKILILDRNRQPAGERVIPIADRRWRMQLDGIVYDQVAVDGDVWSYAPNV